MPTDRISLLAYPYVAEDEDDEDDEELLLLLLLIPILFHTFVGELPPQSLVKHSACTATHRP